MKSLTYVANQITPEGLDEIQLLYIAGRLGIPTALAGPPGTGKTEAVRRIAEVFNRSLFTKTCAAGTTEAHIVSFPALERDGDATVTRYKDGPLLRAMREGGILYADEFNLLKDDVQKRLNSALDDRRSIDRMDGIEVSADPRFWAVVSYNPINSTHSRDIEESVADRMVHLHFSPWDAQLTARLSLDRVRQRLGASRCAQPDAKDKPDRSLSRRGITHNGRFVVESRRLEGGTVWRGIFDRSLVEADTVAWTYHIFGTDAKMDGKRVVTARSVPGPSVDELADKLSVFADSLADLGRSGNSRSLKKLGLDEIHTRIESSGLAIHIPTVRIVTHALAFFMTVTHMGMGRFLAQSMATRIIIDQCVHGQYRRSNPGNDSVVDTVFTIAHTMGLIPGRTKLKTDIEEYVRRAG